GRTEPVAISPSGRRRGCRPSPTTTRSMDVGPRSCGNWETRCRSRWPIAWPRASRMFSRRYHRRGRPPRPPPPRPDAAIEPWACRDPRYDTVPLAETRSSTMSLTAILLLSETGDSDPSWVLSQDQEVEFLSRLAEAPVPPVAAGSGGHHPGYA